MDEHAGCLPCKAIYAIFLEVGFGLDWSLM